MKRAINILTIILCSMPMWVQSQEINVKADTVRALKSYKATDNWFIGVHGGLNHSLSENARHGGFWDMTKPSFAISAGKFFSPALGARVQFGFHQQQSRANEEAVQYNPIINGDGNYGFNIWSGYVDGLLNFNNLFGQYRETTRLNILGFFGLGFNYTNNFDSKVEAWDNEFTENGERVEGRYKVYTDESAYLSGRVGLMATYKLNEALDLTLEGAVNIVDDAYNGLRYDNRYDSYATAMVGLTYHFKDQYGDRRFRYTEVSDADVIEKLNDMIAEEKAVVREPEKVVKVEKEVFRSEILNMTVSFIIDKYNITDIQKKNVAEVAKYLEEHPDVNIVVTGYADVQTAYPAYNLKLSERRAKSVFNCLVNEFGVSPDRLRIDFKGDTIQPYKMKNEWNRVVIFMTEQRKTEE